MNKLILSWLSSSVLISSILSMGVMLNQAQAMEPQPEAKTTDSLSCIRNKHKVTNFFRDSNCTNSKQ